MSLEEYQHERGETYIQLEAFGLALQHLDGQPLEPRRPSLDLMNI
jgi:hypothetical protein